MSVRQLPGIAIACALCFAGSRASAGVITYQGEAFDHFGNPTPGITFEMSCGFYIPNYGYVSSRQTAQTDAAGRATIVGNFGSTQVTGCTFARALDDRMLRWKNAAGVVFEETERPSETRTYPAHGTVVQHVSRYNAPAASHVAPKSLVKNANAYLFLGQDGVYDKPIVVFNGFDPGNMHTPYSLWSLSPLFLEYYHRGVDVWVVTFANGRDSVRELADEAAHTIYYAQETYRPHGYVGYIPAVVGLSQGGLATRAALAGWEHAYSYKSNPNSAWFSFGNGSAGRYTRPNVGLWVALDAPIRGAVGAPTDLQTAMWKALNGDICDMPWWADALAGFASILLPPIGFIVMNEFYYSLVNKQLSSAAVRQILESPGSRDMLHNYCYYYLYPVAGFTFKIYTCDGDGKAAFFTELARFNGNGLPRLPKRVAVAQGNFDALRCETVDQWGPSTCKPTHVHTHAVNEMCMDINLPSECATVKIYARANDIQGGSIAEMVGNAVATAQASGDARITNHFSTIFIATKDAVDMNDAYSRSSFHDVLWAPKHGKHSDYAGALSPDTVDFLYGYTLDFTHGDRDGFVQNAPIYSVVPMWAGTEIKRAGAIGKLCGSDATRQCGWQSSSFVGCGDGVCTGGESCDTCPTDCGYCHYCGDGACNGWETCSDCPTDCGSCNGECDEQLYYEPQDPCHQEAM